MKTALPILALALGALSLGLLARADREAVGEPADLGVRELVRALPFTLAEPYPNDWRADGGPIAGGYLVVLRVDPERARPTQDVHPVLYAGGEVLERVNHGDSGVVVGIVPGPVAGGAPQVDLGATPFWFGAPELPERVDRARIASERASAERAGLRAPRATEVTRARARDVDRGVVALAD